MNKKNGKINISNSGIYWNHTSYVVNSWLSTDNSRTVSVVGRQCCRKEVITKVLEGLISNF